MPKKTKTRIEKDSLGSRRIPLNAYYGAQTDRAIENYQISGLKSHSLFIDAYVTIKKAAAITWGAFGKISSSKRSAIVRACDEILKKRRFRDQFVVDIYQMGAGTSIHMNVNEVIANRANEILGGRRGVYNRVHPNDDVNMGQSTNDTYPTAMRLSAVWMLAAYLEKPLLDLEKAFLKKSTSFDRVLKSGRTHLQDAVPIRLGQEFHAYAGALHSCRQDIEHAKSDLLVLGLGGSAAGTGLNTRSGYAKAVAGNIRRLTGLLVKASPDLCEAMQSQRPISKLSASLRNLALELTRISNDLRLMASGPMTGLAEIELPAVAPGSSIMPGKVNPSILEMVNMVCFQVVGCDTTIAMAVQAGQLELNVMMPVMSANLNFSIMIMGNATQTLNKRCVSGIKANRDICRNYAQKSMGLATALNTKMGYAKAAEVAKEALKTRRTLIEIVKEKKLLTDKEIKKIMDPFAMTAAGRR